MPYSEQDGLKLYYERAGSGSPELVFVHGWCCDHTLFQPQFDHFAPSCSVTTLDLRGCGKSDRPPEGYDIPTLADDVVGLCGNLGITKPVIVGHSLGGMICVEIGARHPSVPGAIVAVDPGPIHPTPESTRIFEGLAAALQGPDGEAVRRAYVVRTAGPTADDALRRRIVDTMCDVPLWVAAAVIHHVTDWNGVAALALCEQPALLLRSGTGGSNAASRLLPLKPGLQVGITVGSGHFHQLEVPEQVNAMIERFLALYFVP